MKQENKEILLRDLCARLPYGVKLDTLEGPQELDVRWLTINMCNISSPYLPYLFPLSSMTKKQKEEIGNLGWNFDNFEIHNVSECIGNYREFVTHSDCFVLIDWLNKNHFDYHWLIEKGLAIDATGLNIY